MLRFQGEFSFWLPEDHIILPDRRIVLPPKPSIVIPNRVVDEGAQAYLLAIFRNTAPTTTWYIGLCNQAAIAGDGLAEITASEPGATGGYARQSLARSGVGWPTLTTVNDKTVLRSATVTFTASGADFDAAVSRAFLASVASGTAGTLFSVSGALTAELIIEDGQSFSMQYSAYLF